MNKKKPRKNIITCTTDGKVTSITILHNGSGEFSFPDIDPSTMRTEKTYDRDSKKEDKVLSSVYTGSESAIFDIDKALKKYFSYVISIDTNTKLYKGAKICFCTAYHVPYNLKDTGSQIPFKHLASYLIVEPKPTINPETIGWHIIIKNHIRTPVSNNNRIAIIIDSEKQLIPKFNSRKKPYYSEYLLPESLAFIYASDKDKDSLQGQMLKMCHNLSNQIYRKFEEENYDIPSVSGADKYHNGHQQIEGITSA